MSSENLRDMVAATERTRDKITVLMDKLFAVTKPGAVFSEPISAEGTTVITASEVAVGMGVGFGSGLGSDGAATHTGEVKETAAEGGARVP